MKGESEMANIALLIAGGSGNRMHQDIPIKGVKPAALTIAQAVAWNLHLRNILSRPTEFLLCVVNLFLGEAKVSLLPLGVSDCLASDSLDRWWCGWTLHVLCVCV